MNLSGTEKRDAEAVLEKCSLRVLAETEFEFLKTSYGAGAGFLLSLWEGARWLPEVRAFAVRRTGVLAQFISGLVRDPSGLDGNSVCIRKVQWLDEEQGCKMCGCLTRPTGEIDLFSLSPDGMFEPICPDCAIICAPMTVAFLKFLSKYF